LRRWMAVENRKMENQKEQRKPMAGFTLIEIMVVVMIIGMLAALVGAEGVFALMLQVMVPLWQMLAAAGGLVVLCVAVTAAGPPVLAKAWMTVEGVRFRSRRASRRMPPVFDLLLPRRDPVSRAMFRREMVLNHTGKDRLAIGGLNAAMAVGLVVVNTQLGELMTLEGYGEDFYDLITPVMVGLGIYIVCFFQAVMPLVDGVSKEGPAFWAVRVAPVEPWRFLAAKVRPMLAFLPLTVVATGFAIPLHSGPDSRLRVLTYRSSTV